MLYFPRAGCNDQQDASGWAEVGGRTLWLDGWTLPDTVVHELGHNEGLDHSRAARCRDGAGRPTALAPVGACTLSDDPSDLMGASARAQFGAPQKARLGWLAGRTQTLTPGSTVRIGPLETSSDRDAAVLTTPTGRRYWVEYRRPLGLDDGIPPGMTTGPVIRLEDATYASTPVLLDMTPETIELDDAALPAGRTWRSPDGYTFSASQADATGVTVTVRTDSAPAAPTSVLAGQDDAAGTATLTWSPPTSDGGRPVTGYRVSRDGIGSTGTPAWSAWMPADTRSRTFVNLAPGTSYTLTVRAVTAAGDGPPVSRTVTLAPR